MIISGCITLIVVGVGYWLMDILANHQEPVRQMSFREVRRAVKVAPVVYESREMELGSMGRVIAEQATAVNAEVQGELLPGDVPLKTGQRFSSGQVMFRIDDSEARLALYAQRSSFMNAVAGILPDLRIDFPNALPRWQAYFEAIEVEKLLPALPEATSSSEKVFLSTRNILNQYYNIKSAEERLSKYVVRAPYSGSYIEVNQEVRSRVNAGSVVARIARSNRLEIEAPIRKDELPFVKQGMAVTVAAESGNERWQGRITRIGSILDPTTQSVNVYVALEQSGGRLYEGQYLQIEMPGTRLKAVMEIPRNALVNQSQVYVVTDSSRLRIADIQIEKVNTLTVLFSGLEAGARVVVEPLFNAYENMPVQISGEEPVTAPAKPTSSRQLAAPDDQQG
ncbi:MAG: hypothetical protein OHK0039_26250 [Bacteroidia bacterium]